VSEFTQLALYMAATVAGMVTALLVARRPFFEALLKRVGGGGEGPRRAKRVASRSRPAPLPSAEESLPLLAEAIIGNTKAAVASVFGPPRSAAVRGVVKSAPGGNAYWQASTWYYPCPAAAPSRWRSSSTTTRQGAWSSSAHPGCEPAPTRLPSTSLANSPG
jgi:hypothetical protein